MPRNGSGTYTAPANSANPAVPFTTISSASHNAVLTDLIAALTDSLSRSGSGGMQSALAMGSNKITGLANGTNNDEAINKGQADTAYQASNAALTAFAAIATTGHIVRTGAATYATRTITGSAGRISVTNGDGVSGNPTIDWDGVQVRKNSAGSTFTRRRINLIEGTNVSLTVSDDSGDDEVDVTITASVGAGFQTIQTVDTTNRSTASTSYVTSSVSASITPASATNRVLVTVQANVGFSAPLICDFTLDRSGTLLTPSGVNSFVSLRPSDSTPDAQVIPLSFSFIDSPATTSARTYSLFWKTSTGTLYLGRRGSDTSIDTVSAIITLQELPA